MIQDPAVFPIISFSHHRSRICSQLIILTALVQLRLHPHTFLVGSDAHIILLLSTLLFLSLGVPCLFVHFSLRCFCLSVCLCSSHLLLEPISAAPHVRCPHPLIVIIFNLGSSCLLCIKFGSSQVCYTFLFLSIIRTLNHIVVGNRRTLP